MPCVSICVKYNFVAILIVTLRKLQYATQHAKLDKFSMLSSILIIKDSFLIKNIFEFNKKCSRRPEAPDGFLCTFSYYDCA